MGLPSRFQVPCLMLGSKFIWVEQVFVDLGLVDIEFRLFSTLLAVLRVYVLLITREA